MRRRPRRPLLVVTALVVAGTVLTAPAASAFPVATDPGTYAACGRVFPDPQAYWPSPTNAPGQSPWAKGNVACRATDFISWREALDGMAFLEELFPRFVEVYDLSEEDGEFADVLDLAAGEGKSAGLPRPDLSRQKVPLYLLRITDETVPEADKELFAFPLSIHGIERAGVEGGLRAAEDLATWGSCELEGADSAGNCGSEGEMPHPILETTPEESLTAGEVLQRTSTYFVLANPDGWRRGDKQDGGFFYQRYNGNGMDMNRDWPAIGFTFRPYTPWSEPETRSFGRVLQSIRPTWTGGIDLHGQLIDRAFSFTLLGGSERPYGKDRRVLQFVKGAWADAEERLAWSPAIKPNDAPESDPRVYGVQWGTIWDTIDYTVTGAFGDWIDSPLGLNADGIDNEMSLSHLSNCGVGTCFIPDAEQLHVDGNKSLIYAMLNYALLPEDQTFRYEGKAAYLYSPRRLQDPGRAASDQPDSDLPPQDPLSFTMSHGGSLTSPTTHEFDVAGAPEGVYNGGLKALLTCSNAQGVSPCPVNSVSIDRQRPEEENPTGDPEWQEMNSYFNQSELYLQSGMQVDVNYPPPGRYRVRIEGDAPAEFDVQITFTRGPSWPDPGQAPVDASNMDFFDMLADHVPSPEKLTPVPIDAVLSGAVDLRAFDTVIAVDDAIVPGYRDPAEVLRPTAQALIEGSVTAPPGAPSRNAGTTVEFEFDVEQGNASLEALADHAAPADLDIFLQQQRPDGEWSGDVASGTSGSLASELLSYAFPQPGHYRLVIHNWAGPPGPVDVSITFYNEQGESGPGSEVVAALPLDRYPEDNVHTLPTRYDVEDRDAMAAMLRAFAEQGGNLVLTDDSLRALEWMGIVAPGSVRKTATYAGYVQFSVDGGDTSTYEDPLAANVDQPGAAEGEGHRHQVGEPVPIGYAIQNNTGSDFNSMPQWGVDPEQFDEAKGRAVGVVGVGDVTLGEVPLGDGVVRVLGSFLTFPTDQFDHPFGLESYAITYTGYELGRNLLDWRNPNGLVDAGGTSGTTGTTGTTATTGTTSTTTTETATGTATTGGTPETGGGSVGVTLGLLGLAALMRDRRRRRRP